MQRFKKRIRLLAEKLGGTISYEHDGSLIVTFATGRVQMRPLSLEHMQCDFNVDGDEFPIPVSKTQCFDIILRLATAHLSAKLRNYKQTHVIEISDFISEEQGGRQLAELRQRIAEDPSIESVDLGGNRLLAEYYQGYLILVDDLCVSAANVVPL